MKRTTSLKAIRLYCLDCSNGIRMKLNSVKLRTARFINFDLGRIQIEKG